MCVNDGFVWTRNYFFGTVGLWFRVDVGIISVDKMNIGLVRSV